MIFWLEYSIFNILTIENVASKYLTLYTENKFMHPIHTLVKRTGFSCSKKNYTKNNKNMSCIFFLFVKACKYLQDQ